MSRMGGVWRISSRNQMSFEGAKSMSEEKKNVLLGLTLRELTDFAEETGQPSYRGRQLFEALYGQRVESLEKISTLPQELRRSLGQTGLSVGIPAIEKKFVSTDGTVRYLIGFADGQTVETVWMPQGDGGEAGDGSEAGVEAETANVNAPRAEALSEESESIAALKRCATQNPAAQNALAEKRARGFGRS